MTNKIIFPTSASPSLILDGVHVPGLALAEAATAQRVRSERNFGTRGRDIDVTRSESSVTIVASRADRGALQRLVCGYDPNQPLDSLPPTHDMMQGVVCWRSQPSGDGSRYAQTEYYGLCSPDVARATPEGFRKGNFPMAGDKRIPILDAGVYAQLITHTKGTGTLKQAFYARSGSPGALDVFAVKVQDDGRRLKAQISNGGACVTGTAVTVGPDALQRHWDGDFDYLMVVGLWTGAGTHITGTIPVTEMNLWSEVE